MYTARYRDQPKEDVRTGHPASMLALPAQRPPVYRGVLARQGYENPFGAEAAQTRCDNLTGLAQQMCYDVIYPI